MVKNIYNLGITLHYLTIRRSNLAHFLRRRGSSRVSSPIWISRTLLFSSSRKCDRNIQNEGPAGIRGFQLKIGKILSVNNVNVDRLKRDIKLLHNGDINIFQLILILPAVEVFCDVISPVADVTIMDVPERRFENCVCLKKGSFAN